MRPAILAATALFLLLAPFARAADDRLVIDHVRDVREAPDAYWVVRSDGRTPVRIPRSRVVRHRTELDRWFEVLHVERA